MYKLMLSYALALILGVGITGAQTIQDARKLLLQERYESAKNAMEKVLAAGPSNPESIYWMAQVLFEMKNINGAKDVLRKGMEGANGSNPLLLVAMGQAELAEKKVNDRSFLRYRKNQSCNPDQKFQRCHGICLHG